jgi:hypothetical protein
MPCDMSANQRHSVPVSKTCYYGQVTAVKQQSNIAVLVLRQQFSLSAACVLHALALVCQALKGYVTLCMDRTTELKGILRCNSAAETAIDPGLLTRPAIGPNTCTWAGSLVDHCAGRG